MALFSPGGGQGLKERVDARLEKRQRQQKRRRDLSRFVEPRQNRALRESWVIASLLLVLIGVAADEVIVALVGAAIFVAGWLARLWGRWSLRLVETSQELSQTHAFVGEAIEWRVRIENRKLLPLPWLELRLSLPPVLAPNNRRLSYTNSSDEALIDRRTSMRWYERIVWTYKIPLVARGFYQFGETRVRSGDLFGFFTRQREDGRVQKLWVYPETVPLDVLDIPLHHPYGETAGGQPLFEDPTRLKGLRDYRGGDPLKRVDWKATARHHKLQSRIYDPSSNPQIVIALNVTTVPEPYQGFIAEIYEQAISVAATLATAYADEQLPFGLISNCSFPTEDSTIRVPAGRSDRQLLTVLEALAMVDSFTLVAMDRLVDEEARRLPLGSTIVLITALTPPRLAEALRRVKQRGHQVAVIYLGILNPPEEFGGVPVQDVRAALDGIAFTRVDGRSLKRKDLEFRPESESEQMARGAAAGNGERPDPGAGPGQRQESQVGAHESAWARPGTGQSNRDGPSTHGGA